jgi:CDP-paratose 2-epimerase
VALKTIIVTGSAGLVGSECVRYFAGKGYRVVGIDCELRPKFYGPDASTRGTLCELVEIPNYEHCHVDIRAQEYLTTCFLGRGDISAVIHCAAQPSHDWAAKDPITDFEINARGTLNLLEATRKYCPQAAFVYMSTNKVYGDRPNWLDVKVLGPRYDLRAWDECEPESDLGINEHLSTDSCTHSLFGCSKLAADLYVQEYGRYFGMSTVCFRGGCLTGPAHAGTKLHGFLSYLVKCCVTGEPYTVIGYDGKQVRDNIHACDLVTAFDLFIQRPSKGAVYNIGGGRENSCSVLEAIAMAEEITGRKMQVTFEDTPRVGDHKWWISDTSKFRADYPEWKITKSLREIVTEIAEAYERKAAA